MHLLLGLLLAVASPVGGIPAAGTPAISFSSCPRSLQRVVDEAPAGAVVVVPRCVWRETVQLTRPLTLKTHGGTVTGEGRRDHAFVVTGSDVTIAGFEIRRTTNRAQEGAVEVRDAMRFTLRNVRIHDTRGACISISGGSGHRIIRSELAFCGQEGFHLSAVSSTRLVENRIHHNNPNWKYDTEWEAGGGKAAGSRRLAFVRNRVYRNHGPGLWCDLNCHRVTYRANRVHHNTGAGILYEISDDARFVRNRAWENGWHKTTWGWGGGIVTSSSRDIEITENTVAWNADGISVVSQDRSSSYGFLPGVSTWNDVENVSVHDNTIAVAPQRGDGSDKFTLAWLQDWGSGDMYRRAAGNLGARNIYWYGEAEPTRRFAWRATLSTLTEFNGTRGERSGRYTSRARLKAWLARVGIPTAPIRRD